MTIFKDITFMILKEDAAISNGGDPTSKYKLFCDLDGVLVDFETGAEAAVNDCFDRVHKNFKEYESLVPNRKDPKYSEFKLVRKVKALTGNDWNHHYTWKEINKDTAPVIKPLSDLMYLLLGRDKSWWANLGWAAGGKKLWAFIEKYEPTILSSGMGSRSEEGKREWCQRELGLSGNRVIIIDNKGIDIEEGKTGILIDDRTKSLGQFKDIGIRYVTGHPDEAIEELKKYGFR